MSADPVVSFDIGGTKTLAGLVARDGTVLASAQCATPLTSIDDVVQALDHLHQRVGGDRAVALGISTLALVDRRSEKLRYSGNVPLEDVPLAAILEDRYQLPVAVANDGNAAALAEHRLGAGRGVEHMLMIVVGTGIGGGAILDGKLYEGSVGVALEVGQIRILGTCDDDGDPPTLTRVETVAGGAALDRLTAEVAAAEPLSDIGIAARGTRVVDARLLLELAEQNDGRARQLVRQAGHRLGAAVVTCIELFNPQLVVLGGGVFTDGNLLLSCIRETARREVIPPGGEVAKIVRAELGASAGMRGAAIFAHEIAPKGMEDR